MSARVFFFILFCVGVFVSISPSTSAQIATGPAGEVLVLSLFPQTPTAYQTVQVRLESFSINLNQAHVKWFFNDKEVQAGPGVISFAFRAGAVGTVSRIRVEVTSPQGIAANKEIEVRPAHVAIGWEADTYTPPFYTGKALYAPGAVFTATAFPTIIGANGTRTPSNTLVYRWYKDDRLQNQLSGVGRQKISFIHTEYIRPFTLKVEVVTPGNQVLATAQENITVIQPEIQLYEQVPLMGIVYEKALGERFLLEREETTLVAEPFFFNARNRNDSYLSYAWQVSNTDAGSAATVTLRPTSESGGFASAQLTLRHISKILQSTRKAFTVQFSGAAQ